MNTTRLTKTEIADMGDEIYEKSIRRSVETPDNIGMMIMIDVISGDYEIGKLGSLSALALRSRRPDGQLYGKRIGFEVPVVLGGAMRRVVE